MNGYRRRLRRHLEGYLFISPWLLGTLLFTAGPVLACFGLSFCHWDLFSEPYYIGLANFRKLSHDPIFYRSIVNTFYYTAVAVPLGIVLALALALLVNHQLRGITVFRTVFFLPNIVAGIAMLLLWKWIFDPNFGLLNEVLDAIGIMDLLAAVGVGRPQWLCSRGGAMPAMIVMSLWGVGGSMILLLAGLQSIPKELVEAAELDGAGLWQRFLHITLPFLTPTLFFLSVIGVIGSLQTFNQAYVMTRGGPAYATMFYCLYLFKNAFESFRMGYACAMAALLFVVTLLISLLQVRLGRKLVHYR